MNHLLEVREFEIIISNPDYKTEYAYLPDDIFGSLEDFIHEYTNAEGGSDALEFMKVGYKRNLGRTISVNNYVGLIQMKNGYQIEVLPKIDLSDDDSNIETKKVFLKMLRSMKDFPSKAFTAANLQMSKMNLYEVFINMYIQEVRKLLRHGIKSSYVVQNDNLRFYKGKLDVSNHIKTNIIHKERFFMNYDEYLVDRAENRIVKATLEKLGRITQSAENQKEIRQQLPAFEMVSVSHNYQKDFSKISLDRTTEDYRTLMEWSKVFLFNKSFTTFSGSTSSRSLLFPMEKVYEAYVARHMKKIFGEEGWNVSSQDKGYYLFDTPKKFALRPDIVISRNNHIIVFDTKWKRLLPDPGINYGINQGDMYQMYAYSKKYSNSNAGKPIDVILLYPQTKEMKDRYDISYTSEDCVKVKVFFIDVADIENSLRNLLDYIKINEE